MNPEPTWVVTVDGGAARFFVRARAGFPLAEMQQLAESAEAMERRHSHPLHAHDHVGHGRRAVDPRSTPHEQHEHIFLRHVAGQMDRAVIEHAVGKLVICAPPRALGLIRNFITDNTRAKIACEISKDLLRETTQEIDERLKEHNC